jgi:hypothetical protein
MILRSIVILVAMAAGTGFALDHPRLPHRVLHVISPVQLKATCPADAFACAIVDWASAPAMCTCLMHICQAGPQGGSCSRTSSGTATAEGRIRVPEGNRGVIGRFTAVIRRSVPRRAPAVEDSGWCGLSSRARRSTTLRLMVPGPRRAGRSPICRRAPSPCPRLPCCRKIASPIGRRASASGSSWARSWNKWSRLGGGWGI